MIDLERVWRDDVFNRRQEAEDVIQYLENVVKWPAIRQDGHAHVLAIDGSYGQGKTFFLKRLDQHLKATEHVSAYVDAWTDDLEDQPLVALAATLDGALSHWTAEYPSVRSALQGFVAKAGKVAKIVSTGLLTKAIGLGITEVGAQALHGVIAGESDEVQRELRKDALAKAGDTVADNLSRPGDAEARSDMADRIARFRGGQQAVKDMKQSLRAVVAALQGAGMKLPITIIVDELDRCRPTYAIKVLEEIKHLFDVEGVAFVLGMHGRQLAHSVQAAYGSSFDGHSYLRRFFNRAYSLQQADLASLIAYLFKNLGINANLMDFPHIAYAPKGNASPWPKHAIVAEYMKMFEMTARDAFSVSEAIHVALALAGDKVIGPLVLPMIIARIKGENREFMDINKPKWTFVLPQNRATSPREAIDPLAMFKNSRSAADLGPAGISAKYEAANISQIERIVYHYTENKDQNDLSVPANYRALVAKIGRFMPETA